MTRIVLLSGRVVVDRCHVWLAFLALGSLSHASVIVTPSELQDSVRNAPIVIRARVTAIEGQTYVANGETHKCGSNYRLKVQRVYKGNVPEQPTMASFSSLSRFPYTSTVVGQEFLLLLERIADDSDPRLRDVHDVSEPPPTAAKKRCLAGLSRIRQWGPQGERAFALLESSAHPTEKELAYTRSYTRMPEHLNLDERPFESKCAGRDCETSPLRRVSWPRLEPLIESWVSVSQGSSR